MSGIISDHRKDPIARFVEVRLVRGSRSIVDGVSFEVHHGETLGLLGRNGAGKTSCLRMLNGLISPDEGSVEVLGRAACDAGVRRFCGYVPEEGGLDGRLTGMQNLVYSARLFSVPRAVERINTVAGDLGVRARLKRRVKTMSKGERQSLAVVRGILHRPSLLLLDEPFSGLDVEARDRVYALVRRAAASRGAATIVTSHVMEDITAMCDRVVLLEQGRVVRRFSLDASVGSAELRSLILRTEAVGDEE